jgi:hypothetical protein
VKCSPGEPLNRVLPAWPFGPLAVQRLAKKFSNVAVGRTRVDLEHRRLENLAESAAESQAVFDSEKGWSGILQSYAELTKR